MPGFPAKLLSLTMQSLASYSRRGDGHLWMIALGLSLLANLVVVAVIGMAALKSVEFRRKSMAAEPAPPPPESVATIFAERAASRPAQEVAEPSKPRFARTTEEQAAPPEAKPAFIGERDTRATSDRAPDADAPPLPSQAGITPKDADDIETTESDYRDGSLSSKSPAVPAAAAEASPPVAESAVSRQETAAAPPAVTPKPAVDQNPPPPREKLMEGPNPVDMPVPRETATNEAPKPAPEKPIVKEAPPPPPMLSEIEIPAETLRPKSSDDPAFSGNQRKTAVTGSISRTGTSALDVEDSPLGRYQAIISRAVEQEWQRNCVRHRDFITPGFLTVRFFVEADGKVRSVQFVGDMETGEVQKGFTLNSIRNAEIPAMSRSLRKEYDKEPLELIFRFYF
jgi:outer membrane biosynthesis protein TonB